MAITNKIEGLESDLATSHPLISWRSVVAGLLIAFFTMIGLLGLGMGIGGINMDEATGIQGASMFTGIWFSVSVLISLFVGSYFAARVSKFQYGRIGSAQGLVIAALFLGFFLYQTVSAVGSIGSAAGNMIGSGASMIGQGAKQAFQSPTIMNSVNNMAENAMNGMNLKSDPKIVASGVANRLMSGDADGARDYLAFQAGVSPQEAQARITQFKTRADQTIDEAKEKTATGLKAVGWSLFLLVVLGSLSAVGGGALGSVANFRHPLSSQQFNTHRRQSMA